MNYSVLIGNDNAKDALKSAVASKKAAHAYVFGGPEGSGKRTLAAVFAGALLCQKQSGEPCGQCINCKKAQADNHPDIITMRLLKDKKSIGVEQIRDLLQEAFIKPNEASKKVFIIDQAHTMTVQAQNALLKVFEEPLGDTVFILLCETESMMLPTILSRAVTVKLVPVYEGAIEKLSKLCPKATKEQLEEALELSGGIIGKARKIISDKVYLKNIKLSYELLELASKKGSAEGYTKLDKIKTREDFNAFLTTFSACILRALKCKEGFLKEDALSTIARSVDKERLIRMYDAAVSSVEKMEQNANISLTARAMLIEILGG